MTDIDLPVTPEDEPFWRGLKERELRLQRCGACGFIRHPASFACPECLSREFTWHALSGNATVETFVWYLEHLDPHNPPLPDPPYNVAVVKLEEGPRLISNVAGVAFGELAVGDAVTATFDDVSEEWAVLRFRPVRG